MIQEKSLPEELDIEWTQLILEALRLGIAKEEIREFLSGNKKMEVTYKNI